MNQIKQRPFTYSLVLLFIFLIGCAGVNSRASRNHARSYSDGMSDNSKAVELYHKAKHKVDAQLYDQAIELYNQSIIFDPEFAAAYTNRGNVFGLKGQFKKAFRDHSTAIGKDPKFARAYFNRGGVYASFNKHFKAITDYTKAIDLNPVYARTYAHRGYVLQKLGDMDRALLDYDRAISLKLEDSNTYYNRGVVYDTLNIKDHGIADYIKASQLNPENFKAFYNLACVYSQKNDMKKTLHYLMKAKEAGFTDLDFLKKDRDLVNFMKTKEYQTFLDGF